MLRICDAETVKERVLKTSIRLEEAAVPSGASGLLDFLVAEEAVEGAVGRVREYTMTGAPPVPTFPASDEVEALERGKPVIGCVTE